MKELIIGIIIAVVFISLLTGIILYFNKNNTQKKKHGQKTTSTPPNPQSPTSKKSRDWWKTLRSILWTLLSLFLVIWIGIWIARGVKKLREPSPKPRTEKISEPVYQDDYFPKEGEPAVVIWKKGYYYGYKYYGKIFYIQSFCRDGKVSKKILQGNNIPTEYIPNIEKEIVSFYKEEGKISVFYSKDIEEIRKIPD